MPYSYQEAVSDGTLVELPITIEYLAQADLTVFYNGQEPGVDDPTWSWKPGENVIVFSEAVAEDVTVLVLRRTDADRVRYIFSPLEGGGGNAQFTSHNMDQDFKQLLFIAQESRELQDQLEAFLDTTNALAQEALAESLQAQEDAAAATSAAQQASDDASSVVGLAQGAVDAAQDALDTAALAEALAQNAEDVALGIDAKATQAQEDAADALVIAVQAADDAASVAGLAQDAVDTAQEALDAAELVVERLADPTDPADGAAMVGFRQPDLGSVTRSVGDKFGEFVSVKDFGAVGDGVADDDIPIRRAIAAINARGGTLYFPPGHYRRPYLTHADDSNWIEITRSGVTLAAAPGSVTLENFLFYVHGTFGPLIPVGAGFTSGDEVINTAAPHGLGVEDHVQLLSVRNAYTPDAGAWQLGSQNPTNLGLPECRFSEIHKVKTVDTSTECTLTSRVIFPGYANTSAGLDLPMEGITTAHIRKLAPIEGFTVSGITFLCKANNFRGTMIRGAVNVRYSDCRFISGGLPGKHLATTDTDGVFLDGCTSYRLVETTSGSSWNTFILGGGTQNIRISNCRFENEAQTFDISPGTAGTDIGYIEAGAIAGYRTAHTFSFNSCTFINCGDGLTTHPGTYDLTVVGCTFESCNTAIRLRSKRGLIANNNITARYVGVSLSAFHHDVMIVNNLIVQQPNYTAPNYWHGISASPLSSEIMNGNNTRGVVISGNTFKALVNGQGPVTDGVRLSHSSNGVPANPAFNWFTDAVKVRLSEYTVSNNTFIGCGSYCGRWVNGTTFSGNSFVGGNARTHYIWCDDNSARNVVHSNTFKDNLVGAIRVGVCTDPVSWGYGTAHRIGHQERPGLGALTYDVANSVGVETNPMGYGYFSGLNLSSGSGIKAARGGAGGASIAIDVQPSDGTSSAQVTVFTNTTTSGSKTFRVSGRVQSDSVFPNTAGQYTVGISTHPFAGGYTATEYIVTSDRNEKQQIVAVNAAEARVALRLKSLVKRYKFNKAVTKKGDGARLHFGWIAQEVQDAFAAEGLDGFAYGCLCYDEWAATQAIVGDNGEVVAPATPAGKRMGVRMTEIIALILSST